MTVPARDPVSGALAALRISGAVLLSGHYAAPWSIAVPSGRALSPMLGVQPRTTAIPFHFVVEGHAEVRTKDGDTHALERGDAIVSLCAEAHWLEEGDAPTAAPLETLLDPLATRPGSGGPPTAALICGAFMLDDAQLNPLIASLPAWLRTRPSPAVREQLAAELAQRRPGSDFMTSRLLELMLADGIRDACERSPLPARGALRGLRDGAVGAALSHIHQAPRDRWTVERLAKLAGLSPSRFRARFRETVGLGPIAYLTALRLDIAAQLLQHTDARVSEVADQVGYDSLAAFSRAFKRHRGVAPEQWRARGA